MWHLRTAYDSTPQYDDLTQNRTNSELSDPPPSGNPPPQPENTAPPPHTDRRRSRRREVVTPRPSAGSANVYRRQPRVVTQGDSQSSCCSCCKFRQDEESKIFRRLMVTFVVLLSVGTVLILVGIIFLETAQDHYDNNGSVMPLFGCIMAIVSGACMIGGSIILGKCIMTYKWRRNLRDRHIAQANRTISRTVPDTPEPDPDLPPPYEDVDPLDSCSTIFVISGENINVNITPPALSPPQYTDLPPQYSPLDPLALDSRAVDDTGSENRYEDDLSPYLQTYEVIEIHTLPSLAGVQQDPPAYDDPYPNFEHSQTNQNPSASESSSRNNNEELPDPNGIASTLIEEETAC